MKNGEQVTRGVLKITGLDLFRVNLKLVREAKQMTQKELSEKAGLKQMKRIGDIEGGRGNPDLKEVMTICQCLGVSIDKMLLERARVEIIFEP